MPDMATDTGGDEAAFQRVAQLLCKDRTHDARPAQPIRSVTAKVYALKHLVDWTETARPLKSAIETCWTRLLLSTTAEEALSYKRLLTECIKILGCIDDCDLPSLVERARMNSMSAHFQGIEDAELDQLRSVIRSARPPREDGAGPPAPPDKAVSWSEG